MATSPEGVRTPQSSASGYISSPSVHVTVGQEPDQKEFVVHEGLICPRSDFSMNAMKEPWQEAQERKVELK